MPELSVGDILSRPRRARAGLVTARADESVRDAARRMAEHSCGSVLVMDGARDGDLVGIFTERDLLVRVVAAGRDPAGTRVAEVMTRGPETIDAETSVREAVRRMDEGAFRHLPVVDEGRVVGVLSIRDVPALELGRMADELDSRHRLAERLW